LGIGDWGLGQSPIPNPQSIYFLNLIFIIYIMNYTNKIIQTLIEIFILIII
jgi:hypothetical protein